MKGKPPKKKVERGQKSRLPLMTDEYIAAERDKLRPENQKRIAAKRARIVSRMSTVVGKLRIVSREEWLTEDELTAIKRALALAEHARARVQNRLT